MYEAGDRGMGIGPGGVYRPGGQVTAMTVHGVRDSFH